MFFPLAAPQMSLTLKDVSRAVELELRDFRFSDVLAAFRPLLVAPRRQDREWEYCSSHVRVECWIIAQLNSSLGIAYSQEGHGPSSPWGLVYTDSDDHCGPDCSWYSKLEDAFIQSGEWNGMLSDDYEVA
jgi:hypothetical protein